MTPIERELSPKVTVPTAVLALAGAVLLVASFVVKGADDLAEGGVSLLVGSGVVGGIGYRTSDPRVDALLDYYRSGGVEPDDVAEVVSEEETV